jgi:hypothetical protein
MLIWSRIKRRRLRRLEGSGARSALLPKANQPVKAGRHVLGRDFVTYAVGAASADDWACPSRKSADGISEFDSRFLDRLHREMRAGVRDMGQGRNVLAKHFAIVSYVPRSDPQQIVKGRRDQVALIHLGYELNRLVQRRQCRCMSVRQPHLDDDTWASPADRHGWRRRYRRNWCLRLRPSASERRRNARTQPQVSLQGRF